MALDLGGLSAAAPSPIVETYTAQVVRADESGLWVVPLGEDVRNPVGPCRGGWTSSGTRVPPGAVVILVETAEGPWAVGIDNPALAINDSTLAPFQNASFELLYNTVTGWSGGSPSPGWSSFWGGSAEDYDAGAPDPHNPPGPIPAGKYRLNIVDGGAAHGLRSLRFDGNGGAGSVQAVLNSSEWVVPPGGSSIELSVYARGVGDGPRLTMQLWSNTSANTPGPFASGADFTTFVFDLDEDWLRYRATVTIPPTHTRVCLYLDPGSTVGLSTVWLDNADADLIEIDPAAAHQDYLRRAPSTLGGGGIRTVTAGGTVTWSQPLTIAAAGRQADEAPDGRFDITFPPNGTVIPVHSSGARVSHTVAGGVIALDPDEALWYELPLGAVATSQPARFHILGASAADGFTVPPHWILVVRRRVWSASSFAPEYVWGTGAEQDPWRTPALNAGWIDGTILPRFTKDGDQLVTLKGRVRSGAGSAFTLPPGYAPGTGGHTDYVRDGAGAPALITITSSGVVTTSGNNTDHSIATSFVAEA